MRYRGKTLDPISFWSEFVDIKDDTPNGEFLPLTYCPNPDHDNNNSPAFQINVERPLVHCFSYCGISGSYRWAISVIEGVSVAEAEKRILRQLKIGSRTSKKRLEKSFTTETVKREIQLSDYSYLPPDALAYLESRGINGESAARFELGFDREQERITIPARDHRGRLRFLIRRAIWGSQQPKYLYDEGSEREKVLYGACLLDVAMVRSEGLLVVEGSLDAVKLHQHGLRNTVAILGSHASAKQIAVIHGLRPRRIFFMFDRDLAGVRALESSVRALPKVPLLVCRYPAEKFDPAELTRKEAFRSVEKAVSLRRFNAIRKGVEIGA